MAGISPSRWKGDSQLYQLQLLLKRLALKLCLIAARRMSLWQRTSTEVRSILGLESRIGGVLLSRYSWLEYGINMELRTLFLYLTKFEKRLGLCVFLKQKAIGAKVRWLQIFQIFQSWKIRAKSVCFLIWYQQPRGLLSTTASNWSIWELVSLAFWANRIWPLLFINLSYNAYVHTFTDG